MTAFPKLFLFLLPVLAACASNHRVPDLTQNETIYQPTGFVTKVPGDRSVVILPLQDLRNESELPGSEGVYPILYHSDNRWSKPVADMVDEILREELAGSKLFARVAEQAADGDLILQPRLIRFAMGAMELKFRAKSLAEVAIEVQVLGPKAADGTRPELHRKVYSDRIQSGEAMIPVDPVYLAGQALRRTMVQLGRGLDGSNVARSAVPAEASAPAAVSPAAATPAR